MGFGSAKFARAEDTVKVLNDAENNMLDGRLLRLQVSNIAIEKELAMSKEGNFRTPK